MDRLFLFGGSILLCLLLGKGTEAVFGKWIEENRSDWIRNNGTLVFGGIWLAVLWLTGELFDILRRSP